MPHTRLLPWILTSIVASVASAVSGAHSGQPLLSWAAVLIFAGVLVATSLELNRPWWETGRGQWPPEATAEAAVSALETNTQLLIVAYAWGGIAMFAVYRLSGLHWQHGWQYAAGMGLIAFLLQLYAWTLAHASSRLRQPRALVVAAQLSVVQALAALTGIIFLLVSGKFASPKGDWAANQIFVAGGVAVAVLSAICAVTHYRLMRAGRRTGNLAEVGSSS